LKLAKSRKTVQYHATVPDDQNEEKDELKVCLICLRAKARYTCPQCQVWYCSAVCYSSDRHQDCSEDFFKKQVNAALRSDIVDSGEKTKMIDILKRQKQAVEDEYTLDELDKGFDEIDLDDFNAEEALKMMDKEERAAFETALAENTLIDSIRATIEPWWHKKCVILTDDLPQLHSVPRMSPALLEKVNPLIFLSICELLASYCYVMARYLHDPDDLIEEAIQDLTHISSAFTPSKGEIERDGLFWRAYDQMRLQSDDDQVALVAFEEAARVAETQLKMQLALSDCLALISASKKKKTQIIKKIEFYLAWINEGVVPPEDYVENLNLFYNRIKKEMASFEDDKQRLVENMPKTKPNCQLITEL